MSAAGIFVEMRRPHLVLSNFRGDNRLAGGQFINLLDYVLRHAWLGPP